MRTKIVQHRNGAFTADVVAALAKLEERLSQLKAKLQIRGRSPTTMTWTHVREDPGPTNLPPEWSAVPTGREVYLRLQLLEDTVTPAARREREIAMLWGIAIPLGFTPFTRYPLPGPHDEVFHYMGEWGILVDHLLGSGRGEEGWPSFCCAAQIDIEKWEGPKGVERLVQSHLHRLGYNIGAVDGIIGTKTQGALHATNLHSMPLTEVAHKIVEMAPHIPKSLEKPIQGRLDVRDGTFSIHSYGRVRTARTITGADLYVSGSGRVVIDFREP